MSFAPAPSPSAWFERAVEGDDVAIRVVGGIETRATTFMDAVREMAAADARATMAMRETTSFSPVAVARSDAGRGRSGWRRGTRARKRSRRARSVGDGNAS